MTDDTDDLGRHLADGWVVAGYSTVILAAGAIGHSVLLQKGTALTAITTLASGEKEHGRVTLRLTPQAEKKRGFFG